MNADLASQQIVSEFLYYAIFFLSKLFFSAIYFFTLPSPVSLGHHLAQSCISLVLVPSGQAKPWQLPWMWAGGLQEKSTGADGETVCTIHGVLLPGSEHIQWPACTLLAPCSCVSCCHADRPYSCLPNCPRPFGTYLGCFTWINSTIPAILLHPILIEIC